MEAACSALCTAQAGGEGCDAEAVEPWCEAQCAEPLVDLTGCEDEALASWRCLDDQAWACSDALVIDGIEVPQPVDAFACATELTAFEQCLVPEEPDPVRFHGRGVWCDAALNALTWVSGGPGVAAAVRLELAHPDGTRSEHHVLQEQSWDPDLDETTWTLAVPIVADPADWAPNVGSAHDCLETWAERWTARDADDAVLACAIYADETGIFDSDGCDVWPL